jgi:hypothetical protein
MEKFIKNLWHDVSEKPTKDGDILFVKFDVCGPNTYNRYRVSNKSLLNTEKYFDKWCYLDEILPKVPPVVH